MDYEQYMKSLMESSFGSGGGNLFPRGLNSDKYGTNLKSSAPSLFPASLTSSKYGTSMGKGFTPSKDQIPFSGAIGHKGYGTNLGIDSKAVLPGLDKPGAFDFGQKSSFSNGLSQLFGGVDSNARSKFMSEQFKGFNPMTATKDQIDSYKMISDQWDMNNAGVDYAGIAGLGMNAFDAIGRNKFNKANISALNSKKNIMEDKYASGKQNHKDMVNAFQTKKTVI